MAEPDHFQSWKLIDRDITGDGAAGSNAVVFNEIVAVRSVGKGPIKIFAYC